MGECNYCSFKRLKKRAKEKGMVVKKVSAIWGIGGYELFVVPKTISVQEIRKWKEPTYSFPNGDENWKKYSSGWMMEIPNKCCC